MLVLYNVDNLICDVAVMALWIVMHVTKQIIVGCVKCIRQRRRRAEAARKKALRGR